MSDATDDVTASNVPDPDPDETDEGYDDPLIAEPPHPINWNLLNADDAEVEWLELNRWVDWLRHTYDLPVPPAIRAYMDRVRALPAVQEWIHAALAEHDFVPEDEPYRTQR